MISSRSTFFMEIKSDETEAVLRPCETPSGIVGCTCQGTLRSGGVCRIHRDAFLSNNISASRPHDTGLVAHCVRTEKVVDANIEGMCVVNLSPKTRGWFVLDVRNDCPKHGDRSS